MTHNPSSFDPLSSLMAIFWSTKHTPKTWIEFAPGVDFPRQLHEISLEVFKVATTMTCSSPNAARLTELLEEQYDVTEAYANAQTLLWNVTQKQQQKRNGIPSDTHDDFIWNGSSLVHTAAKRHYDALRHVQDHFQQLQQYASETYPQHLALTMRVLQTLAHNPCSWQSNGIPVQSSVNHASTTTANATVAMAALKASIFQVMQEQQNTRDGTK
jgi:hypothetical protein